MTNSTYVHVTLSTDLHPTDRNLVGKLIASSIFVDLDYPEDNIFVNFYGTVTHECYSALCVLEDRGLLTVEQV